MTNLEKRFSRAIKYNDVFSVRKCLKEGVDVNTNPYTGRSPLANAIAFANDFELIEVLIEAGADLFYRSEEHQCNLLHIAIQCADDLYRDKQDGYTSYGTIENKQPYFDEYDVPEFEAYLKTHGFKNLDELIADNHRVIMLLLEAGVSLTDKDTLGHTPLSYIVYNDPLREFLTAYLKQQEQSS